MMPKNEISQTKIKEGFAMTHFPILSKEAIELCISDYLKITKQDEATLVELNGFACAKEILDQFGPFSSDHIVVYAGPAQNGKNGIATALFLAAHTKKITICMPSLSAEGSDDFDPKQITKFYPNIEFTNTPTFGDCYIDALFGIELNQKPDDVYEQIISILNQQATTIVSIDVPSGVDADTSSCAGEVVKPNLTLAVSCLKPVHCTASAKMICGDIACVDAGLPREFVEKYAEKQKLAC